MADTRVSQLTGLAVPTDSDELYIVDVSDSTDSDDGTSKKVARLELFTSPVITNPTINLETSDINIGTGSAKITQSSTDTARIKIDNSTNPLEIECSEIYLTSSTEIEMFSASNKTLAIKNDGTGKGNMSVDDDLLVDTILEETAAAGVTIDSLLIKDGGPTGWDGWMIANETWTYASASTFTVAANVTAKYPIGTKIKWTQTTVKYGIITATSWSSPNTTVTIAVNTDYTITNAAISLNYYSYQSPHGFPSFFNWAPVFDGFSADPTGTFEYQVQGRTCYIDMQMTSDGTSDQAYFKVALPIASQQSSGSFGTWTAARDNTAWLTAVADMHYLSSAQIRLNKVLGTDDGWTNSGAKRAKYTEWYFI